MSCYIVIFDVSEPAKETNLITFLKTSFSGQCRLTKHSWAITTEKKATEVRDQLSNCVAPGDRIFVLRSGTEAAWRNALSEKHSEWLKKFL
jgi:hypothetical protein